MPRFSPQSCPTLCDLVDCSPPGLPVHHHSRSSPKLMSIESVTPSSHLIPCCPLLLPFSSPGDLPNPGVEPRFPTLQADSVPAEPQGKPAECPSGLGRKKFRKSLGTPASLPRSVSAVCELGLGLFPFASFLALWRDLCTGRQGSLTLWVTDVTD